jgi:hypothetical protein
MCTTRRAPDRFPAPLVSRSAISEHIIPPLADELSRAGGRLVPLALEAMRQPV